MELACSHLAAIAEVAAAVDMLMAVAHVVESTELEGQNMFAAGGTPEDGRPVALDIWAAGHWAGAVRCSCDDIVHAAAETAADSIVEVAVAARDACLESPCVAGLELRKAASREAEAISVEVKTKVWTMTAAIADSASTLASNGSDETRTAIADLAVVSDCMPVAGPSHEPWEGVQCVETAAPFRIEVEVLCWKKLVGGRQSSPVVQDHGSSRHRSLLANNALEEAAVLRLPVAACLLGSPFRTAPQNCSIHVESH